MSSDTETTIMSIDELILTIKGFQATDLFKLLKAVTTEAEKKTKQTNTVGTTKKTGSVPKGTIPHQLKKPRAWVEFTLKSALENGWEQFTVVQKKKDKESNIVTEEQIEMPASILYEGAYIFEDSITEKTPQGRQIIHKEAMSLSKQRKDTNHPSYTEFEAQYIEDESDDESVTSSTSSQKKIVVKMTAAEKEAEAVAKKAAKELEKAAAKAAKDAEKAAAKAAKELEKEAAKAEKELAQQEKKTLSAAKKKPSVTKALVPAAAVAKPVTKTEEAKPVAAKKKAVTKEDIPNDGMVHPWTHKGKKYLRNFEGETWAVGADGSVGEWAGLYDATTDKIDTTVEEPVFEDSE
jgi:hypothetical protein